MKEEARGDGDGTPSKVLTRGVLTRRKCEKTARQRGGKEWKSYRSPLKDLFNLMNGMMNEEQV